MMQLSRYAMDTGAQRPTRVTLPAKAGRHHRPILLLITIAALITYFGSYVLLSASGGYVQTRSGDVRMSYGLSTSDVLVWQPRFGMGSTLRTLGGQTEWNCDALGLLYHPLMAVDQRFVHRTIRFLTIEKNHLVWSPGSSQVRMHPTRTAQ